ncbi:asparaginase domain-containing protein [Natronospira bacteriovora]|uniref:Asparaginase domain-containing protein n=1 Tax=Natronospira bacteriovora TaxID=3069753 RepID=A0ABU0W9P7_9GAMM|nr:asparaginase domain-containing protein [Natronospira sp. AB-CW4]MDQ2070764.1 asparaginase domain-containing protein [Natronospira sp. AB-CW4]
MSENRPNPSPDCVRIITTGGTIDKIYFDARSEFEVGDPVIGTVLEEALVGLPWVIEPLMQKDSLEMSDQDRERIREAVHSSSERHILITHGTDTMSDTAAAIGDTCGKVVVLTGSLSPARFRSTDAIFNIGAAFAAVQALPPGTWVFMNGQVFPAGQVRKNRETNRFEGL